MDKKEEERLEQEEEEESLENQKILKLYNISLKIENYNYIFSDFDPRPFSQRALSVDFLEEADRASREMITGAIELNLMLPRENRNLQKENVIKRRLREHFGKHYIQLKEEKMSIIRLGISFLFIGMLCMFAAAYFHNNDLHIPFLSSFLIILLEPASWFLFWEGLNQIIFDSKKIEPKLKFYEKMRNCIINFYSY
jgi:hypothetical protein